MILSSSRFNSTLYELSQPGRSGLSIEEPGVPETPLPNEFIREDNGLPEVSELDVTRHYLALATRNFGIESGFYPLGSCTMKYNPKINEQLARLQGFANSHPREQESCVQGNLQLMYELQLWLAEIGGFDAVSLQPSAGAHGEFTALLMIRAYHADQNDQTRTRVLVPDSAHGTNPASTTMAGYEIVEIPTDERGNIDIDALRAACKPDVAAIMLTNPNTLGLFDENLQQVTEAVHECGGLVYGDGANMNALSGIVKPAHTGVDVMHYNLHKTFATPHGGGGPGAGPLAVSSKLADYLPGPIIVKHTDQEKQRNNAPPSDYDQCAQYTAVNPSRSIGRLSQYFGNFGVFIRAFSYIRGLGAQGLKNNAMHAVLNANYLRVRLQDSFPVPFDRINMHEFVCAASFDNSPLHAIDISKRLMDFGVHPPTNNFPLIVREALMIEPTECETKETLDAFVDAMLTIANEGIEYPERLTQAPNDLPIGRIDEVHAARKLKLQEFMDKGD